MNRLRRRRQDNHGTPDGFTLPQLLIAVAIIAILSGVTISISLTSWRDAQAGELALRLAGWLEQVSRSPETTGGTCTVTFTTGTRSNGAVIATATSSTSAPCSPEPTFAVPTRFGNQQISVGASASSVVFTPRHAITSTTDVQVRLALENQAPVRCVRLSSVLGLIRVGRNDTSSSTATDCPAASFDTI